jgi:hypothetical protein
MPEQNPLLEDAYRSGMGKSSKPWLRRFRRGALERYVHRPTTDAPDWSLNWDWAGHLYDRTYQQRQSQQISELGSYYSTEGDK